MKHLGYYLHRRSAVEAYLQERHQATDIPAARAKPTAITRACVSACWHAGRPDPLATDENFNNDILRGLLRRQPDLDIVRIQDTILSTLNTRGGRESTGRDGAFRYVAPNAASGTD